MKESAILWIALKNLKGVGERTLKKLYMNFGSAKGALNADKALLKNLMGNRFLVALEKLDLKSAENIVSSCEKEGVEIITIEDEDYPQSLREIPDPPPVLFVKGIWKNVSFIGVVGTRNPTTYTLSFTEELVKELVEAGYGIISGGARGVDSTAHFSALKYGGYTVCVLGMGIFMWRGKVFERILENGGALISEFMPEDKAEEYTFARRNRIIAGMAEKIVITEAGERSGALITANYAHSYGKEIYVHIGIGRSPKWAGCYNLVKEGKAKLFMEPEELTDGRKTSTSLEEFLKEPRTFDDIVEFLKKPEQEVHNLILQLEIEGKIKRMGSHFIAL